MLAALSPTLGFQFARPPVDRIVAEVGPPRTEVGKQTTFTYFARITNTTGRPGFTRFEIETPARIAAIHSVEIQDRAGNRLDGAEFSGELADVSLPLRVGSFSIEAVEDDHFALSLPLINVDGTLLKIVFDGSRVPATARVSKGEPLPMPAYKCRCRPRARMLRPNRIPTSCWCEFPWARRWLVRWQSSRGSSPPMEMGPMTWRK